MIAWYNDELLPLEGVGIKADDRGFLLGDGLFETCAAQNGQIEYLRQHLTRLQSGLDFLDFDLSLDHGFIQQAMQTVLKANGLLSTRASLRLTVTRGSGPRGLLPPENATPNILITAAPCADQFPSASVKTVSIRRNPFSPTSQLKSLCYLDNQLALREAKKSGADEALLLNCFNQVTEGSVSNIFIIQGDLLLTPSLSSGVLPGIIRQRVLDLTPDLGFAVNETEIDPGQFKLAEAVFLTNSLFGVRPVHQVDDQKFTDFSVIEKIANALKTDAARF